MGEEVTQKFIHLSVHTTYSLLGGIASPKALAKQALADNQRTIAVTDWGNVFGAMDASGALAGANIQPILGCQVPVWQAEDQTVRMLTLLVQNRQGWLNLSKLVTQSNLNSAQPHTKCVELQDIITNSQGLICLTGGARYGYFTPILNRPEGESHLRQLQNAFGDRLYIELQRHNLSIEQQTEADWIKFAENLNIPVVATNDVRFMKADQTEAYNALVCIGESRTLDDPQRSEFGPEYTLRSQAEMLELFKDIPEAIENTLGIAKRCGYWLEEIPVKEMFMPKWPVEEGQDVAQVLRQESAKGLRTRLDEHVYPVYPDRDKAEIDAKYNARLEEELEIIISMGFDGYFLITSDFIRWAKEQDIPVGPGRGSGAGSLVAWCLEITDLDPIRWDLYFERFLNPERVSLPDFDIDFCQERREEVIKYVQRKYGDDRVSQIITYGTLKARACIRDVGRVLQLPYGLVNKVASFVPEMPNPPSIAEVLADDERLRALAKEEEDVQKLLDIAQQLEGCLRHASTHAAGVMISDRPIVEVCGLYHDPRAPMPATQFDMKKAEMAGLVKFDFLGLKTLTQVQKTCQMIVANGGPEIDVLKIPLDDEKTYDMLCAGHTVGVFQIESAGMTDMTKRMIPRDLEALSALVALYRPGPLGSGMVDDYIDVRHGKKETQYPHPLLEPALKDTFGVPVYQEQIMRMARDLAGYTLGGADMLRRAMGKKKPEEMAKQRDLFVTGATKHHKIPEDKSNQIFDLMAVFAGYGFNKAHSLAYAFISYQTAYLKAHHPLEFMAATMTLDRGNTDKLMRYRQELHRMGAELLVPDVNMSFPGFVVEDAQNVRHALGAIKGAGDESVRALVAEREENGKFKTLWDMLERLTPENINRKTLEVLAKAGALDSLIGEGTDFPAGRAQIVNNLESLIHYIHAVHEAKNSNQIGLFGGAGGSSLPDKPAIVQQAPWDSLTQLQFEQAVVGFFLSAHPLDAFSNIISGIKGHLPIGEVEAAVENGRSRASFAAVILGI